MLDRLIKSLAEVPEHMIALALIAVGSAIAIIPHLPHAYEVGSPLAAAGPTMFRGKQQ